jgi:hypothetical protein
VQRRLTKREDATTHRDRATTPAATNGFVSQALLQGYTYYWMHKVAGIDQPKPSSNGFGRNLLTAQSVALKQEPRTGEHSAF